MRTDNEIIEAVRKADHYAKLAGEHTNASSQLACLILANYYVHQWSADHGGPTQEMVQLAEKILSISGVPPTPAQQSEQDLRQRILESLIFCQDGAKQYLRFCPVDVPPFRHGISLNIKLGDDHERDRKIVADYLVECIESLIGERTTSSDEPGTRDVSMTPKPPPPKKYDPALSVRLVAKARALITDTDEEFPFPDKRAMDLAIRLVTPGPKATAVSASECHEITKAVIAAYDQDAFPIRAHETIAALADQLEAEVMRSMEQDRELIERTAERDAARAEVERLDSIP